jgi:hypothetical protein
VLYRKYNATKIFKPERYKMQNMTKTWEKRHHIVTRSPALLKEQYI